MEDKLKKIKEYLDSLYGQVSEGDRYNAGEIVESLIKDCDIICDHKWSIRSCETHWESYCPKCQVSSILLILTSK